MILRKIDKKALNASKNEADLNLFVYEYENYILKCASNISKRFITKSDDEWSVALEAFCTAVKSYSYEKGGFLGFADMVIKRRLTDYFRSQTKHKNEFSVSPYVFSGESEEDGEDVKLSAEIISKTKESNENDFKYEIEAANKLFSSYGFAFYDLTDNSPKSEKTKEACYNAVRFLISTPLLLNEMKRTKSLPLKIIENNVKIPRKLLERHRKYIIAVTEILNGDFPNLAEYLWIFREEKFK